MKKCIQKINKKRYPQKTTFFLAFLQFSGFFIPFLINFGSQKGSREDPFSSFFSHHSLRSLFCDFFGKISKTENIVSYRKLQCIVRFAVSKKKHAMCWETALEKTLIFSSKSCQNRYKNREKRRSRHKSSNKMFLGAPF